MVTMMDLKARIRTRPSPSARSRLPRYGLYAAVIFILIQFVLAGCAGMKQTSGLALTPVTDTPTGIHYPGKFVWNDLLTDDVPVAKDFYGRLFGWTFEQLGDYTVIKNNGRSIGGMAQIKDVSEVKSAARWLCTLSVADVDKAVSLFDREGGIVLKGPMEMRNRGRGALVRDPQGAQLLLLHASGGDPEDKEPVIGSWLWHELWSNDVDASIAFYQKLAGYHFVGEKTDYLILMKDGQWRAGIRYSANSKLEMRWVPVVRVADTDEIVVQAKNLGGKILVEPRQTADGNRVSLLADPSGALVIIERWSPKTTAAE